MKPLEEAIHALENIVKVSLLVTRPFIQKKTGLKIVHTGQDFGEIVTLADIGVSDALLNGGLPGVTGFCDVYPGSFSEEKDTKKRLDSLEIIQVDPIDGTGDFVDTYKSNIVTPPTTLVSKLERTNTEKRFAPVWGIIFDVVNEIALIGDESDVLLFSTDSSGKIKEVPFEKKQPEWNDNSPVFINRRISYPQLTFDGPFMNFLKKNGFDVRCIPTGGAGISALKVFRNYIQPTGIGAEAFNKMHPLTINFNTQPDWKTWDTNATDVIATALGMPFPTDIFGNKPKANAANSEIKDMIHTNGYVLSTNEKLQKIMCTLAEGFTQKNPDCPLLEKNYGYKDAIFALASN